MCCMFNLSFSKSSQILTKKIKKLPAFAPFILNYFANPPDFEAEGLTEAEFIAKANTRAIVSQQYYLYSLFM